MSFTPAPGATPPPPEPELAPESIAMEEVATLNPQGRQGLGPDGEPPSLDPAPAPGPGPASSASQAMRMPTRGAMPRQTPAPTRTPSGGFQRPPSGGVQRPPSSPSMSPTAAGRPPSGELPAIPSAPGLAGQKIMVGTRLGQIEITGILGKGGMGQVFRGYHQALDIDVAIKVLPDELSRNDTVRQRFLREARLCVKLDHPNIVRVFNVDEWQGNLYLVMELIEGTDAAGMLKDGGRFRFKRALEIGAAAAEALGYAHSQGLVHRDVKPHNILLSANDGKIKLSDFGLARAATSSSHLTMSGQIMGTPHYMSPEQAESKEVTDKSDVYSLGVTIYHMLTGETPFVGDTPISVAVQHIAKEIIFPEYRFAPFPKELVAVLKRMVAKDPAKRCSAKQAAVWMQKLATLIDGDDIIADAALGKTLAPVVAETEAFEAAAQKRRQNDEQAREEANSMILTMREAAAPVMPTMREQAAVTPAPSASATGVPQVIVEGSRGSGGLVAVVVVMALVIGGGGGAWYFLYGPGAKNAGNNQPIAGDGNPGRDSGKTNSPDDGGKRDSGPKVTDGVKDGKDGAVKDGAVKDGVVKDGGPMVRDSAALATLLAEFGKRLEAASSLGEVKALQPMMNEMEALRKEASAAQLVVLDAKLLEYQAKHDDLQQKEPPPAAKPDPDFAAKLADFAKGMSSAASLNDLRALKPVIDDLTGLRPKANSDQRSEHDSRLIEYNDRLADLQGKEWIAALNENLRAFETFPDDSRLRDAVAVRDKIEKFSQPQAIRDAQKTARDEAFKRLETNLQSYFDKLVAAANALATDKKWKDADAQFANIESLPFGATRLADAKAKRSEVAFLATISAGVEHIKAKAYKECDVLIRRTEAEGYPATLKDKLAQLKADLQKAMGEDMAQIITQARNLVHTQKFGEAEALLQKAAKDMPLTVDQLEQLGTMLTFVQVSAPLYEIAQALSKGRYAEADRQIKEADKLVEKQVKDGKEKQLDEGQLSQLKDLKAEFVTKRDAHFDELLTNAQLAVDAKDFNKAASLIQLADALPRTSEQDSRLAAFKDNNQSALRNYLQKLMADAEKAVEASRFGEASEALKQVATIPAPEDLRSEIGRIRARFDERLTSHYNTLHKKATEAFEAARFDEARATLDEMLKLPVNDATAKRTNDLELRYLASLDGALEKFLTEIRDLLKREKYADADGKIALAARLPLTTDLNNKLEGVRLERNTAVENALAACLASSSKACNEKNYDQSDRDLNTAAQLPLSDDQKKRLAAARDDHGKSREAHIESLFRKLAECVARGQEAEGQLVKNSIQKFSLTRAQEERLADLDERLTGLPRSEKIKSLPPKLTAFADDKTLRTEQSFKLEDEVSALYATNDGKFAAMATRRGDVYFYNLRRATLLGKSSGGRRVISSVAVSGDGRWGVSCGEDGALVVFDLSGGRVTIGDVQKPREHVVAVDFSADGKTIYGLSRDGTLYRISPESRKQIGEHKTGVRGCTSLAVDPKGELLAAGGDWGRIAVLDATRFILKRPDPVRVHNESRIQSLCFSRDGKRLMAAGENDGVGVWDVNDLTDKPRTQYKGLQGQVRACGFSADGKRVCAVDRDRRMIAWGTDSASEVKKLEYESLKMDRVEFRPTASFIGPAGTMLIGTREGLVVQFTVMDAK